MRRLFLGERVQDLGMPAAGQFLQRGDVHVAIVEELFERWHVLLEESSIGADGVTAQRDRPRFGDVFFQERERLRLGLVGR